MALTPDQIKLLVIHLVRDLETVQHASSCLPETLFDSNELLEAAIWRVSKRNYKETQRLTPKEHLLPAVQAVLENELIYNEISDDQIKFVLDWIFNYPESSLCFNLIQPILKEFILERSIRPQLEQALEGQIRYEEFLNDLNKIAQLSNFGRANRADLEKLGIDVFKSAVRIPTGFVPLDTILGGIRLGESIGLLGPMKGGKTSFCQSLACEFIKRSPDHRVTFLTYEESLLQQWPKFLICFMNKHHRQLIEGKSASQLTKEIRQDLQQAHKVLSRGLSLIDMSGGDYSGFGGIAELESTLMTLKRQNLLGQLVIVDHALPLVTNYLSAIGRDPSRHMRHEIQALCSRFRSLMIKLNTAGVLAHQMDARGNQNPNRIPTHMDAAESKLFAQYMHDVLCLGVYRPEDYVAFLNLSATRSSEPKKIFVRICGWKCRVEVARNYTIDARTNEILRVDEQQYGKFLEDEGLLT